MFYLCLLILCPSCFPHVINIAVQTALDALVERQGAGLGYHPDTGKVICGPLDHYSTILLSDVVKMCSTLVASCRVSSKRRMVLKDIINEGNREGTWLDKNGKPYSITVTQLLRLVCTRWSSVFWMLDRIVELEKVCIIVSCS